jgi:hypothetical protein
VLLLNGLSRLSAHMHPVNPLSGNVPRCTLHVLLIIMLLCLMPDDFSCQGESAATQWVK